jgi:hypothetical protein
MQGAWSATEAVRKYGEEVSAAHDAGILRSNFQTVSRRQEDSI